jgi:hypothetical protein
MQSDVHKWVELPGDSALTDVTYEWCSKCGTLKATSADGEVRFLHPGGTSCPLVAAEKPVLAHSELLELAAAGS